MQRRIPTPDYRFDGAISRPVLESYLARGLTMLDYATGVGNPEDNRRMVLSVGAKYLSRVVYVWGGEPELENRVAAARRIIAATHARDPEMLHEGGIFEVVTPGVRALPIPASVFREFGLPVESRTFDERQMVFTDGLFRDQWGPGASVPDIRRLETRLWFFHLATRYIDAGCEALHFGQEQLIGWRDTDYAAWRELLERVRAYARANARRHMVLCNAHTPGGGPVFNGRLLYDFHAFPLRIKEVPGRPQIGGLMKGYGDSFYHRSRGGMTPSGWICRSLPYVVEFDNWGASGQGGRPNLGLPWVWGYDEIGWLAHQPAAYRNAFLRYAVRWVRSTDPNGFVKLPGSNIVADPVDGKWWYFANTPSDACPTGFGQEETIKALWSEPAPV